MHRRALALIAVALVTAGAAACGGDDAAPSTDAPDTTVESPGTTGGPDPTAGPGTTDVGGDPAPPDDPDAALLTIDGGVPAITADGRVFDRADEPQGMQGFA